MMKKQGKKNVCLRHEGNAGVSEKKGRFVQMEHNLVQITHYGVPVTPRLHQQLFCSQHSNVKFSQTLGCVYGSNCVCTTEGNLFVETSNEQGFFSSLPLLALPDLMHTVWHFVSLSLRCWLMLFPCSPWKKSVLI